MNTGTLQQLYDHQAELRSAMAQSLASLSDDGVNPLAAANARRNLTRLLTGYQMFKHQRIFDPIARNGTPEDAHIAQRMKIACVATGGAFRAYLARWTASGIEGREIEYRRDAKGMMALLERHILQERSGIETLLAPEKRVA